MPITPDSSPVRSARARAAQVEGLHFDTSTPRSERVRTDMPIGEPIYVSDGDESNVDRQHIKREPCSPSPAPTPTPLRSFRSIRPRTSTAHSGAYYPATPPASSPAPAHPRPDSGRVATQSSRSTDASRPARHRYAPYPQRQRSEEAASEDGSPSPVLPRTRRHRDEARTFAATLSAAVRSQREALNTIQHEHAMIQAQLLTLMSASRSLVAGVKKMMTSLREADQRVEATLGMAATLERHLRSEMAGATAVVQLEMMQAARVTRGEEHRDSPA